MLPAILLPIASNSIHHLRTQTAEAVDRTTLGLWSKLLEHVVVPNRLSILDRLKNQVIRPVRLYDPVFPCRSSILNFDGKRLQPMNSLDNEPIESNGAC